MLDNIMPQGTMSIKFCSDDNGRRADGDGGKKLHNNFEYHKVILFLITVGGELGNRFSLGKSSEKNENVG